MAYLDVIVPFVVVLIFCIWQVWSTRNRKQ